MRILSGLQPTGRLHLGNYFGMMQQAVHLQEQGEAFIFIADYHALTSVHDADELRKNIRLLAVDFLACGFDPSKGCFFRQSAIPEITELAWILSSVTPMGLLERCHSYKDKIAKGIQASHGLFAYPVLMAADILIYDSDLVPVGKDQKQHVEVTRDIAVKMNECYGEGTVKIPEARIQEETAVIPGIDGQKMSKSYDNIIPIFAEEKELRKRVMSIQTDSTPLEDPKPIENSTLLALCELMASPEEIATMKADFQKGGIGYGDFKKRLLEALKKYFAPLREKREKLLQDSQYIDDVLSEGSQKARQIAQITLERVRTRVGL